MEFEKSHDFKATDTKSGDGEFLQTANNFPSSEDVLGPVTIGEKLLDTTELEISNMAFKKGNEIAAATDISSTMIENIGQSAKRKSLTSTEVANSIFAEFEEKLAKTLSQFNVDDIVEMQKSRAVLRNQNEKIKDSIINLEKQLACTKLAHYLIKRALDPNSNDIADSDTVEDIRCQYEKEKNKNEAIRHATGESGNSTYSRADESPTKVVNKTVKRLIESSIIKLPANNLEKKAKLEVELEENSKTEKSEDAYALTDDQLKEFLDQIIKVADEALNAKDYDIPKPKQGKNTFKQLVSQSKHTKKESPVAAETDKKRATRRSNVMLVNPIVHHNCHLCTKGFYTAKDLHLHYVNKHSSTNESNGTFGVEVYDEQTSTKCHLCGHIANSADALIVHKSHHVKPEFCAHKCNKCELKFCLKTELDVHRKICSKE